MAKSLQLIHDEIQAISNSLTVTSLDVLAILGEVVDTLRQQGPSVDVAELQAKIANLTNTLNWQAGILQATKDALHVPNDKTMTQLPEAAAAIYLKSL